MVQVILGLIKRENSIQEFEPLPNTRISRKLANFFHFYTLLPRLKSSKISGNDIGMND